MLYHAGILDGRADRKDRAGLLVLAFTPGVPLEWIYAAMGLGRHGRPTLRDMIHAAENSEFPILGRENAASVQQGDGWRMLQVVCPGYSGPAPLWSKIELENDTRSDAAIAQVLGVDRKKAWRWRKNNVFCPLTGVRLIPNRGKRIAYFSNT